MSYLTSSYEQLKRELIAALEGEGFAYNPLTTEFTAYLATALGTPNAYLRKSLGELLADLDAQYGGSLSHLRSSITQLMDDVTANIGAGGGGGGYVAKAVHWDGTSYLHNDALACGETDKLSFAVWFRGPASDPVATDVCGFWVTDPQDTFRAYAEADFLGSPSEADGGVQFSLSDPSNNFLASATTSSQQGPRPVADTWYAYMFSADVSSDSGPLTAALNDLDALGFSHNVSAPASILPGNGLPLWIGLSDASGEPLDMANFLMWYGQAIDWSVEVNRRFIIDASGKPVDPALAIAEFGAPTVALTGDATAFQANQGSGGSFSLSGSLTNASTSPSD